MLATHERVEYVSGPLIRALKLTQALSHLRVAKSCAMLSIPPNPSAVYVYVISIAILSSISGIGVIGELSFGNHHPVLTKSYVRAFNRKIGNEDTN